jgi:hypothetical protein
MGVALVGGRDCLARDIAPLALIVAAILLAIAGCCSGSHFAAGMPDRANRRRSLKDPRLPPF